MKAEDLQEIELRREWLTGRMHYIDHALTELSGAENRCPRCGEALGTGRRTSDREAASLCLICQRNGGLNASFHTP